MPKRMDAFYVPEEFEIILKELKEILKREGKSLSEWIRENAERYVAVHAHGNPQLRIDKFMTVSEKVCFFCRGRFPQLYKVRYVSGLVVPTCKDCLDKNKAKGTFSTVKKVLGLTE